MKCSFLSFSALSPYSFLSLLFIHRLLVCLCLSCQAGMIRAGQEEFFIEPLERGGDMTGEEEGGSGRHHILYRSSDIKKPAISHADYFHPRGQDSVLRAHADALRLKIYLSRFLLFFHQALKERQDRPRERV